MGLYKRQARLEKQDQAPQYKLCGLMPCRKCATERFWDVNDAPRGLCRSCTEGKS